MFNGKPAAGAAALKTGAAEIPPPPPSVLVGWGAGDPSEIGGTFEGPSDVGGAPPLDGVDGPPVSGTPGLLPVRGGRAGVIVIVGGGCVGAVGSVI